MRRIFGAAVLAWLLWASPASAQPFGNGSITAISTGGACSVVVSCTAFPFANATIVSMTLQIGGTFTGTLAFEACASALTTGCTATSTDWFSITAIKQADGSSSTGFASVSGTNTGQFAFPNAGLMAIRVRATAWTSGTATVSAVRGYARAFGQTPFSLPVTAPASGTCVTPAYTFTGDTDSGIGWLGANNPAGCAGGATIFDWNATRVNFAVPAVVTQGTLTADAQALSTTATWNNAAVTFTHWKAVITDTASGGSSLPINILGGAAGATTLFQVTKLGSGFFGGSLSVTSGVFPGGAAASRIGSPSDGVLSITNSAQSDFSRLQFGGTTSSFPALTRSAATLRVTLADNSAMANLHTGSVVLSDLSRLSSPSDGLVLMTNALATDFSRLQFGGTTSSFPALKRSTTTLQVRLADDSAFAGITAGVIASGGLTADGSLGAQTLVGGVTQRKVAATNAQTIGSFTVGAADASFAVSANILVTTATTHAFTVTCAYTDEGNTARTLTLPFTLVAGTAIVTSVANANGTVPYMGITMHIRAKAATTITIATTGTFTTVTYNGEGHIVQKS